MSDYFGSSEMTVTLSSAEVLMDLLASGDGMGIGKTAETADLLDIGWAARIRGNLTVDGNITIGGKSLLNLIYPVGSIYMSVNATSPQTLFGWHLDAVGGPDADWRRQLLQSRRYRRRNHAQTDRQ